MSALSLPFFSFNTDRILQALAEDQPSGPIKLADQVRYLAREAFTPKDFHQPQTLKQYLNEHLPSERRERTKAKIAEVTAQYHQTAESLLNNYLASKIIQLWEIVKNCVVAEQTKWDYNKFKHSNPQEYVGDCVIGKFMNEMKKHAEAAKSKRGLTAHHIVFGLKIYIHIANLNRNAKGKSIFIFKFYDEIIAKIDGQNFKKLFPNQSVCFRLVGSQYTQLETAILQGKDHTDEAMLPDAVQFQNDYWKDRPSPVIHRGNPYRAGPSAPYSGGMAINTAWNPGGNAPSMVPMVPGSRSPWGYQAGL